MYLGTRAAEWFQEIKRRLQKMTHITMLYDEGRYHLNSGTIKFATVSALYQIQNGKPKVIA